MADEKEPEVMTAADLQRRVQAGEDPSEGTAPEEKPDDTENVGSGDSVTITGEDMMDDPGEGENADGAGTESADPDGSGDAETDGSGDESAAADDDGKAGRSKKKKKREKKDPRDEKIAELNDRLLRNLAEFENFRNRSEREKAGQFDMGARTVVEKILPVVDNLERGLDGLSDEEKEQPFAAGIVAVYKQLQTVFNELGVTPIEAVGQEFDPNIHQAVMHEEDDSDVTNQVVEELQKGYMYKDTVVRYSMVKVLN